jgi:hypothetical protein
MVGAVCRVGAGWVGGRVSSRAGAGLLGVWAPAGRRAPAMRGCPSSHGGWRGPWRRPAPPARAPARPWQPGRQAAGPCCCASRARVGLLAHPTAPGLLWLQWPKAAPASFPPAPPCPAPPRPARWTSSSATTRTTAGRSSSTSSCGCSGTSCWTCARWAGGEGGGVLLGPGRWRAGALGQDACVGAVCARAELRAAGRGEQLCWEQLCQVVAEPAAGSGPARGPACGCQASCLPASTPRLPAPPSPPSWGRSRRLAWGCSAAREPAPATAFGQVLDYVTKDPASSVPKDVAALIEVGAWAGRWRCWLGAAAAAV